MNMTFAKRCLSVAFACSAALSLQAQKSPQDMDRFISSLMSKMTVEEKIGQLNLPTVPSVIQTGEKQSQDVAAKIKSGQIGGVFNAVGTKAVRYYQDLAVKESRLGIPLIFGLDVIHGYETTFPIPLALASSWDLAAIEQSARIAAIEASADGICWTFSPMVDIARDPRWGRIAEGNGEDPFLGSAIARAMVRGYQGSKDNPYANNTEIMSCVKHYALYGAAEAGRDYHTTDMSLHRMYNEYLPPYKAAAEAGADSYMSSFNDVNGVPATANRWLMTDVLRGEWGFKGFVVTDYTAIAELQEHGLGNLQQVSELALNAGIDMDMVSEGFLQTTRKSIEENKVSMATLDQACRRILEAKYKLGLFDNPYKYIDESRRAKQIYTPEHRHFARKVAGETFVLLKNSTLPGSSKPVLPLAKKGTVAVVGPLADAANNMTGTWSVGLPRKMPSLVEGMKELLAGQVNVVYAKGSNLMSDSQYEKNVTSLRGKSLNRDSRTDRQLLDEALNAVKNADVIVAALGESAEMSGESSSRSTIDLPDTQLALLKALVATGKPVVLTLFTGRPLTLEWENEHVPAILNVWFGGTEAAYAITDVLFGDVNPSGKLTATFPKNVGQVPIYYAHKNTGRPLPEGKWFTKFRSNYLDVDNEPLYPFGYGLSYTRFSYSPVRLSASTLNLNGELTATVTVQNTGDYDGDEVVQLYLRDVVGSITRPVKELKGFERIHLKKGESRTVNFKITPEMLKFYNAKLEYVCEPGEFEVMVGPNSRELSKAGFTLN